MKIFVLALVAAVFAANVWSRFVSQTEIRPFVQIITGGIDEQVPRIVIDEDCRSFVKQEPAHIVVFFSAFGCVNRQSEVSATLAGTVLARGFPGGNVLTVRAGSF